MLYQYKNKYFCTGNRLPKTNYIKVFFKTKRSFLNLKFKYCNRLSYVYNRLPATNLQKITLKSHEPSRT